MRAFTWFVPLLMGWIASLPLWSECPSSYPYLSGQTWRHACPWRLTPSDTFDPVQCSRGDAIYVSHERIDDFRKDYLPKLGVPVVLVSANIGDRADESLPMEHIDLLNDPRIGAWFLQNWDGQPHEKIVPIPLGLANRDWGHGCIETLEQVSRQSAHRIKQPKVLVQFQPSTSPGVRIPVYEFLKEQPWVFLQKRVPYRQYLENITRFQFVACPPGNGLDTHRCWETLYCRSIPIVIKNSLSCLYEQLPVLQIEAWEQLNERFLAQALHRIREQPVDWSRIYAPYWLEKLHSRQRQVRESQ
ncbi:MAG: hypothetical protein ACOYKZ_00240 [Chlamydiia bacterium]